MKSQAVGEGAQPAIILPVVGVTQEEIMNELNQVLQQQPDFVEWRADFYHNLGQTDAVLTIAQDIKKLLGNIPAIFTIRSADEGGQPIFLSDCEVTSLNAEICTRTAFEYIDCELGNKLENIMFLRAIAHKHGKKIIASFHQPTYTPSRDILLQKFADAQQYGLDVAKVVVMPQNMDDVLTLLSVTLEAKKRITIPLIAIAMGKYGALSRIIGGVFGSAATFAVGHSISAPGQLPVHDMRTVLAIIEKSMENDKS